MLLCRFGIAVRRQDLNVQCNFAFSASYKINESDPNEITQPLLLVKKMREEGIDDNDEEKILAFLETRLENALFAATGPPLVDQEEIDANVEAFCSVNVNEADESDLAKALTGVGTATAKLIISNRPYSSVQEIGQRLPALASKVRDWQDTQSARVSGEAFKKGMPKKGNSSQKESSQTHLSHLREMSCAFKFLAKVEALAALPDAIQAHKQFRETGIMPTEVGGNIRSSKSKGTNMCMMRNCPQTNRVIMLSLCSRHILKNWRGAVYKGKEKDAQWMLQIAYASVMHMAESKVPLEEGKPGSAISIGEAKGLNPMNVGYATKLFSYKMLEALEKQAQVVADEDLREKMEKTKAWVETGAKFDIAFDHRGWSIPERKVMAQEVTEYLRYDQQTGTRIDTANPGPYIKGIPKCTAESTEITICCAMALYEICDQKGGKAATWVNLRATCSNVCEQLFAGLQNMSKDQFLRQISKKAFILRMRTDPDTAFYMPMNSITKQAKQSHGCFNDESSRHDVPVARSINDTTTTIGSVSLRVRTNSKAIKA